MSSLPYQHTTRGKLTQPRKNAIVYSRGPIKGPKDANKTTGDLMDITTQPWFAGIRKPSRYLNQEIGSIKKDHKSVDLSIALAFPDVYEVGMSHLGLRILYHILNSKHWIAAERVFAPWTDLEEKLRANSIPLCSLETGTPLALFDIVGFSLQHELCYTNVLNMLDLAQIPLRASERDSNHPLVIAGGPACFNPEPVADIFDFMVIGDGEEVAIEICKCVREWKGERLHKQDLLERLRHVRGIYVPSFFRPRYRPDGILESIEPLHDDYPKVVKTKPVDLNSYPAFCGHIVPFTELVHDRLSVEVARGCGRGCRFCQAGFIYRPVRERDPQIIVQDSDTALRTTGYDDLSLLSLSTGDYSAIEDLLTALMNRQAEKKVAISLPSLRIDSLKGSFLDQINRVRKTGFTLAVEAGSYRIRKVINKGLTEQEIISTAKTVYKAGWNLLKLYFMVGLPFEQDKDIEDIIRLVRTLLKLSPRRGKRAHLNVSVATFVPKSHTPFMWVPQLSLQEARRRISKVREALKGTRARVKWNQPEMSWLEGIFSRGDRRLFSVLIRAWSKGARFDAWAEHFSLPLWQEAFRDEGIDPGFYLYRKRTFDEPLPWDHISAGVEKDYLLSEWNKALEQLQTPDCRTKCSKCGVCDHKEIRPLLVTRQLLFEKGPFVAKTEAKIYPSNKYRFTFTKLGPMRFLSHLELLRLMSRALRRANIPVAYSMGFHPMPKISFVSALPVGVESNAESFEVETVQPLDTLVAIKELNTQLPTGITITRIEEINIKSKSPRLIQATYIVKSRDSLKFDLSVLERFEDQQEVFLAKRHKKGINRINLKEAVRSIQLLDPNTIELVLAYKDMGVHLRPEEVVANLFNLDITKKLNLDIRKVDQILQ